MYYSPVSTAVGAGFFYVLMRLICMRVKCTWRLFIIYLQLYNMLKKLSCSTVLNLSERGLMMALVLVLKNIDYRLSKSQIRPIR